MTFLTPLLFLLTTLTLTTAQTFQLTIFDTSSLNGQLLSASSESFYLGLSGPATYCPPDEQGACPTINETLFAGLTALAVEVPGGQQIYVAADGAIGYTVAHSAATPPGAYVGGFTNVTVVDGCSTSPITIFNWAAPTGDTSGILACPVTLKGGNGGLYYQVYAKTPAFAWTNCTEVLGLLPHVSNETYGAWEYE